eukprot:778738-Pelagomonas_calceolata.AAC.4
MGWAVMAQQRLPVLAPPWFCCAPVASLLAHPALVLWTGRAQTALQDWQWLASLWFCPAAARGYPWCHALCPLYDL